MVSCDTRSSGSMGCVLANHCEIWRGEKRFSKSRSTSRRNLGHVVSLAGFGRLGKSPGSAGRPGRPGSSPGHRCGRPRARSSRAPDRALVAISLSETPSASPLEISSRCSSDSTRFERCRGRGRIPPVKASSSRTESTLMRRDLATAGQSRPAPSSSHTRFFVGWSKASPSSGESRCDHPLNSPTVSHPA